MAVSKAGALQYEKYKDYLPQVWQGWFLARTHSHVPNSLQIGGRALDMLMGKKQENYRSTTRDSIYGSPYNILASQQVMLCPGPILVEVSARWHPCPATSVTCLQGMEGSDVPPGILLRTVMVLTLSLLFPSPLLTVQIFVNSFPSMSLEVLAFFTIQCHLREGQLFLNHVFQIVFTFLIIYHCIHYVIWDVVCCPELCPGKGWLRIDKYISFWWNSLLKRCRHWFLIFPFFSFKGRISLSFLGIVFCYTSMWTQSWDGLVLLVKLQDLCTEIFWYIVRFRISKIWDYILRWF